MIFEIWNIRCIPRLLLDSVQFTSSLWALFLLTDLVKSMVFRLKCSELCGFQISVWALHFCKWTNEDTEKCCLKPQNEILSVPRCPQIFWISVKIHYLWIKTIFVLHHLPYLVLAGNSLQCFTQTPRALPVEEVDYAPSLHVGLWKGLGRALSPLAI